MDPVIGVDRGSPRLRAAHGLVRVVKLEAVHAIRVDVDDDPVAVFDERVGPPRNASGATWPITKPIDPPEKRASVISRYVRFRWRQSAVIRDVGSSSSGIPGAPRGPS